MVKTVRICLLLFVFMFCAAMNAGAYTTGEQLKKLGEFYAHAINDTFGLDFDVVFGPAYKGIPLSVVTSMALHELFGKEVRYCSNRKEAKDHGDAGILLGSELHDGDKVLIVEDVTTSGKSIEETYPIVKAAADVEVVGLEVSLNRCEVGKDTTETALSQVSKLYNMKTSAIVTIHEVAEYLHGREIDGEVLIDDDTYARMQAYLEEFGAN